MFDDDDDQDPMFEDPRALARFAGREVDFDADPVELVRIDADQLEFELVMLPALTMHWSGMYAQSMERYLRAKASLEATEAELYSTMRERLTLKARAEHAILDAKTRGTVKLPTDKVIDAAVKVDPSYQAARETLILAEVDQTMAKGRLDAARRKAEALTAIGLKRNAEARAIGAMGSVR